MDSSRQADQVLLGSRVDLQLESIHGLSPQAGDALVDLDKVTSIDKSGEEALSMIMKDGATVVGSGAYTKQFLLEASCGRGRQHPGIPIDLRVLLHPGTLPSTGADSKHAGAGESPQTALRRGY